MGGLDFAFANDLKISEVLRLSVGCGLAVVALSDVLGREAALSFFILLGANGFVLNEAVVDRAFEAVFSSSLTGLKFDGDISDGCGGRLADLRRTPAF